MATMFTLLHLFHILNCQGKMLVFDMWKSLEIMTVNRTHNCPPDSWLYTQFLALDANYWAWNVITSMEERDPPWGIVGPISWKRAPTWSTFTSLMFVAFTQWGFVWRKRGFGNLQHGESVMLMASLLKR
ncbi:hypothetical protein ARMGADRAFT_1038040 [Armillaria gallica]|uniref:Uncharacterized protein n=1 Tax=Armillaria gallica TaxID=47427 RepID=A0A2H3D4J7_ARMGA|nr:hypothetical protein ARMGADRAFT_1038040 [Armillaria gallica]